MINIAKCAGWCLLLLITVKFSQDAYGLTSDEDLVQLASNHARNPDGRLDADLLVIGAGISGLAAALEVADQGRTVLIADMASVEGGHAVMAAGGLAIVNSPLQRAAGIADNPELALQDLANWGEDIDYQWARFYVENSHKMVYEWTQNLGVKYSIVHQMPGNSVARMHFPKGWGLGLITPMIRAALKHPNIQIYLNTQAHKLIVRNDQVVGIKTINTRNGKARDFVGRGVMIATGGFQSNIEKVQRYWRSDWQKPEVILAGSGWYSMGEGLDMAAKVGADTQNLGYMWNYVNGIRDPRHPNSNRGLNLTNVPAQPRLDIWLNERGKRFVNECLSPKYTLPEILEQPGGSHWMVFDDKGKSLVTVSGSGWTPDKVEEELFSNPDITKVSMTIAGLARQMELPPAVLESELDRYNQMVDRHQDGEFFRFGANADTPENCQKPERIDAPPYYAIKRYPLARKSMGGLRIDTKGRVLDKHGNIIQGLYAGGEAAGLAGINGKSGLEGTFLGPSILTGRVIGQTFSAAIREHSMVPIQEGKFKVANLVAKKVIGESRVTQPACTGCHSVAELVKADRPGYKHFEFVHQSVLDRQLPCLTCHGGMGLFDANSPENHRLNRLQLSYVCQHCHGMNAD